MPGRRKAAALISLGAADSSPAPRRCSVHLVEGGPAGVSAPLAGLGADPAVLVLAGMALALLAAPAAGLLAGLDHRAQDLHV